MRSKLLAALLVSEAVHLLLFGIMAEVTIGPPRETVYEGMMAWINNDLPDPNLTNDEIGNDPDLPTNYNIDRIEELDVPGTPPRSGAAARGSLPAVDQVMP